MVHSEVRKIVQVGLMLPDGKIVWAPEAYKTHPLETNDDRAHMVDTLKRLAGEISFPDGELLTHYAWLKREVYHTTVYADPTVHNIVDPELTTPTPKEDSEIRDQAGEGAVPDTEEIPDPGANPLPAGDQPPTLGSTEPGG